MKILLINPPRSPENNILKFAPAEARRFIHKKLIGPPLGLLTIAAAVKDHDVAVFDMKGEYDLDPDAPALALMVEGLVEKYRPQVVGVTVITSEFDFCIEIFRIVKRIDKSILTVAGGLHPTLCPGDFTDPVTDVVIPGQGSLIFREVIRAHEKGLPFRSIPGLWINAESGLTKTTAKPLQSDAAGADFMLPDRSHLKRWISTYKAGDSPFPSTYVFTSLGCPYKCTFCSIWSQFKGKYYQRTIESLICELKLIDEYPVVRFADANTVVDEEFMVALFNRIEEEGIRKTFVMDIRADVAAHRPDIIEKLARGGLKVVICGFESFRDTELKRYRKKSPAFDNQTAVKVFEQNGIMVRGNYVIPNDYVHEDFEALAEYSGRNRVVYAGYTVLTPMPGTVFYKEVKDQIVDHDYRKYNFFNSVMKTKLPHDEFHARVGALWMIKKGTDVI
ncbi:MAG: radical SAM protein [Bacteroidota bacterium]